MQLISVVGLLEFHWLSPAGKQNPVMKRWISTYRDIDEGILVCVHEADHHWIKSIEMKRVKLWLLITIQGGSS